MAKKYLEFDITYKSEWKNLMHTLKKKEVWIAGFVIPFLVLLIQFIVTRNHDFNFRDNALAFKNFILDNSLIAIYSFLLSVVCVTIPIYFITQLQSYRQRVDESLSRIDTLPHLVSFHTENNSFKNRLNSIDELDPDQRWILSKYISKLLTKSFGSFSIELSAFEYSQFSSILFLECKNSIDLTGSMRPSTWLNKLVDESDEEKLNKRRLFFNNLLDYHSFPIDENNHSMTLVNKCNHIKDKFRVVCLNKFDVDHLFISERSIDAYYYINDHEKLDSFFKSFNIAGYSYMDPMKYEYALYDKTLLLKYDKSNGFLKLINKRDSFYHESDRIEFEEILRFFEQSKRQKSYIDYHTIKHDILSRKTELLHNINDSNTLPHKLSYLYSGGQRWIDFIEKEQTKYSDLATLAIQDGLNFFKDKIINSTEPKISLIEIGAGAGDRISTICDSLGSKNIQSYKLLDISWFLLEKAEEKLIERIQSLKNQPNKILLDCCDSTSKNKLKETIKNKFILIPNNSTLFTENGFDWNDYKSAKGIFITLDLYNEENIIETYKDHLAAKSLFLLPLKIFEIPIIENLLELKDDIDKSKPKFFCYEYNQANYVFEIKFKLKDYIDKLKNEHSFLLNEDKMRNNKINNSIRNMNNKYNELHNKFIDNNDLIVLKSLKFTTVENANNYFMGQGFKVYSKESENGNAKFISLLLTPKNNANSN